VKTIASRSGRQGPPRTVTNILDTLRDRYSFTDAVAILRELASSPDRQCG